MEEKGHLDGKERNESSGTNLDHSEGCRGARTWMIQRMLRAKVDAKEGQSLSERRQTPTELSGRMRLLKAERWV